MIWKLWRVVFDFCHISMSLLAIWLRNVDADEMRRVFIINDETMGVILEKQGQPGRD